jgi:hypothetical protein
VGKVDAVATPKRNIKFESFLNFTETVAIESPTADVTAGRRSFPYATWKDQKGLLGGNTLGNELGDELYRSETKPMYKVINFR